jgi:hypothetical protein
MAARRSTANSFPLLRILERNQVFLQYADCPIRRILFYS